MSDALYGESPDAGQRERTMAGRGPAPKTARARGRDTATRQMVKSDGKIGGFDLPDANGFLPPISGTPQIEWHPATVKWWEAFRRSPQAVQMVTEPDWAFLLDTAMMHHMMWVTGNFDRAAEVRIRSEKFGATVLDRMRLKMDIEIPEDYPVGKTNGANVTSMAERRKRVASA